MRYIVLAGVLLSCCMPAVSFVPTAVAADAREIKVVGGLSGVSQFTKLEQPFWTSEIKDWSNDRLKATIHAYDASGFRGQEMLQLMRLGVVPFGTALLAVVAGDEPELNALDLPAMNPDVAALRLTVSRYRERLRTVLRDRYRIELYRRAYEVICWM